MIKEIRFSDEFDRASPRTKGKSQRFRIFPSPAASHITPLPVEGGE